MTRTEVAVVGGGPSGTIVAEQLARAGHEVTLFERSPGYRWRACGVFSWTAMRQLRQIGLSETESERVARPVDRLRLLAPDNSPLTLSAPDGAGLDRSALDPLLLARARRAGAQVCEGTTVTAVEVERVGRGETKLTIRDASGSTDVQAAVVVGADGIRSVVASAAGVVSGPRVGRRIGMSYHVAERAALHETLIAVVPGGYCGIAPVPGHRLNVGIVLDERHWSSSLRQLGAAATSEGVLLGVLGRDEAARWVVADSAPVDRVEGVVPLAHSIARAAGANWILAGDAAGFLDPVTGEGLGRAFATATRAADAIHRRLRGDRDALASYDAAYQRAYRDRDRLTLLLQLFLARPRLLSYAVRRAAGRPAIRRRFEEVLGDRMPASRALDPRFLAALLRP